MNMNKLVLTLLAIMTILPVVGQSEYISNSRDMDSDCIENLDGRYGLLLLSHNKSLVINITNASRPFEIIRPKQTRFFRSLSHFGSGRPDKNGRPDAKQ